MRIWPLRLVIPVMADEMIEPEKVTKICGVSFEWNKESKTLRNEVKQRDISMIAQEIETVFPDLVTSGTVGNNKAIDYGRMSVVLIEVVKSLKAENIAQHEHIMGLESRLVVLG